MQTSSNAPRVLAVLALLAAVIALLVVISDSLSGDSGADHRTPAGVVPAGKGAKKGGKRYYVFQPGDTGLGSVARKTGVPVARLEQLNPTLDTFSLQVGDRIRIR